MIWSQIQTEKKQLDQAELPQITDELFEEYFISGNRLHYENIYFARRKFLTVYGIYVKTNLEQKIQPDGWKKDLERLQTILTAICGETTWALPPHVNRSVPGWEDTIDLFAAETAFALAELCETLNDWLRPEIVSLVKEQVMKRCLRPFLSANRSYAWWETAPMNWCAVCNSCVGAAGLYFLEDGPEKDLFLSRIVRNLSGYLGSFAADGVCPEGLNYYYYAFGHLMMFWELYEKRTGRTTGWEKLPQMEALALFPQRCLLPGGYTVAFSDCSRREQLRIGVQGMLAAHFSSVLIPKEPDYADFYEDACYRYGLLSRDVAVELRGYSIKTTSINSEAQTPETTYCFDNAQWFVRTIDNRHAIAAKGGHNDEPHNHNDVGSFLFIKSEELVLADLGSGEYTKDYFNDRRYENLCCHSAGHNVLLISEKEQASGRQFQAENFSQTKTDGIQMDLSGAYAEPCRITRALELSKNGTLTLCDTIRFESPQTVTENFITLLPCRIDGAEIVLTGHNADYRISCLCINKAGTDAVCSVPTIQKHIYSNHSGQPETCFQLQFHFKPSMEHSIAITVR